MVTMPLTAIRQLCRRGLSERPGDGFTRRGALGALALRTLREPLVNHRIDHPMRKVGRTRAGSPVHPTKGVALFQYPQDVLSPHLSHGPAAPLDIPMRDRLKPMSQDVAGDLPQLVVI